MRSRGSSTSFPEGQLRLLQPEHHVHLAVHRLGGRQVLLRPRIGSGSPIERAEAKVAMGRQWAHAEILCQGPGFAVAGLGLLHVGCSAVEGDLAEKVEDIGLVAALLMGQRELTRVAGESPRALTLARDQKPVSEMRGPEREVCLDPEFLAEGYSTLEQG
jgi:hypothetical protein